MSLLFCLFLSAFAAQFALEMRGDIFGLKTCTVRPTHEETQKDMDAVDAGQMRERERERMRENERRRERE